MLNITTIPIIKEQWKNALIRMDQQRWNNHFPPPKIKRRWGSSLHLEEKNACKELKNCTILGVYPLTNCFLVIFSLMPIPSVSKTDVASFFGCKSPVCFLLPIIVNLNIKQHLDIRISKEENTMLTEAERKFVSSEKSIRSSPDTSHLINEQRIVNCV